MDIRFSTFLVFVALLRKELRATITVGPSNTVASIGGKVNLTCTADQVIGYWYFSKNGVVDDEVQILQVACSSVMPGFTDNYAMESIGGGTTCNLIVANITMAQAGIYKCAEGNHKAFSILTVTDSMPTITDNSTTPAVEKENVVIDCVLNYNGSSASNPKLQPYFYWTNSTGQRFTSFTDSTTENTAFSQLAVTAGRQNIAAYTCHVYFILNPAIHPNYASNVPTVNSGATSRTIEVHYYPAGTSLTSTVSTTDNCVYKQETLTCTADANPPAQYEWRDLSNNAVTPGATKDISIGGQYQCIAFNFIRGQRYNNTKIQTVTTCSSPQNLTISGPDCADNSCTCKIHGSPITLTCMANGYPEPTYSWWSNVSNHQNPGNTSKIDVKYSGIYNCTASNRYGNQNHPDTDSIYVSKCPVHLYCYRFKDPYICILVVIFLIYFGLGGIFGVGFVIYIRKTGKQKTSFTRFPFLKKMLPCLNNKTDEAVSGSLSKGQATESVSTTTVERVGWIFLYILMSITVGIVMIPYMLIKVNGIETAGSTESDGSTMP